MKKLRIAGWTLLGLLLLFGAARLITRPIPPTYPFLEGAAYQGTKIDEQRRVWRTYRMPGRVEEVRKKAELEVPVASSTRGQTIEGSSSSSGPDGMDSWSTRLASERFGLEFAVSIDAGPKGTVVVRVLDPPTLWDRFLRFCRLQ